MAFRIELFVVLEHGIKVGMSIARFVQVKGAASGLHAGGIAAFSVVSPASRPPDAGAVADISHCYETSWHFMDCRDAGMDRPGARRRGHVNRTASEDRG